MWYTRNNILVRWMLNQRHEKEDSRTEKLEIPLQIFWISIAIKWVEINKKMKWERENGSIKGGE